jgi:hypothetical protein
MHHVVVAALLGSGAAVALVGLWWVFSLPHDERGQRDGAAASRAFAGAGVKKWPMAWLFVVIAAALALRLEGLDRRGITHVEIYVPGIRLPSEISEPPPRIGIVETALWHFHDEPHPQGYYFFMWCWTRAFGTSLKAIRLPSVLCGVAAVVLLFLLAARLFDPLTGLIAAGMLALNGHQIFWSQWARMYAPAGFLAILSTLLLVSLLRSRRRSRRCEIAYVGVTWLMLFTELLSWGLLGGQIVAALRFARTASGRLPRIVQLQGLVVILGAPLVAHAIYGSRPFDFGSEWKVLRDYFNFGFLFEPDSFSEVPREVPLPLAIALAIAATACLRSATRRPASVAFSRDTPEASPMRRVGMVALGVSIFVLGLATLAWRRQGPMALAAAIPIIVTGLLYLADVRWYVVRRVQAALSRLPVSSEELLLMMTLAFVPTLALGAVHLVKPLLTSRGAIVFTPFLLAAIAAGVTAPGRRVGWELVAGSLLLLVHAASVGYYRSIPAPIDYRGMTAQLNREYREGDLVFVPARSWATTPLFYGLAVPPSRIVASDYAAALAESPSARVWVPLFVDQSMSEEVTRTLASRRMAKELVARRARAELFVP